MAKTQKNRAVMCQRQHHVLVAIALMTASILLQGVRSTATNPAKLPRYEATTAYDVLEQNNLPRGLLPLGVKSYELNPGGGFEVTLPGECNFFVTDTEKKIKFRYDSDISGIIKSGSISRLSGARIQGEFGLLGFNQVSRAGNLLNFRVQSSTQSFRVSAFSESANCSGLEIA